MVGNSGTLLFNTVIPAAQLQAMVANHYYWLGVNRVVDGGLAPTTLIAPPADAVFNASAYDRVKIHTQCVTLTGAAGGVLGLLDLAPQSLGFPLNSAGIQYFWTAASGLNAVTSVCPEIAQTQSSGSVAVTTQVTVGGRLGVSSAFTLFFSTAPNPASPLYVAVYGY